MARETKMSEIVDLSELKTVSKSDRLRGRGGEYALTEREVGMCQEVVHCAGCVVLGVYSGAGGCGSQN